MQRSNEHFVTHDKAVWHKLPLFSLILPLEDQHNVFEQLITDRVGKSEFKLLCIPFFLYNLALGDVIEVKESQRFREGLSWRITATSGRCVFRLCLEDATPGGIDVISGELLALGALVELCPPRLLAIDAENSDLAAKIKSYLETGQRSGRWVYEIGKA